MGKDENLKPAKTCFGHIGGKLGMLLMENLADKGWIAKKTYYRQAFLHYRKGRKGAVQTWN